MFQTPCPIEGARVQILALVANASNASEKVTSPAYTHKNEKSKLAKTNN